ncbi:MAG: FAD-dependent thymidylate synthase [Dehalococcoidia bacterium]|nr:FAD-dependent thymidylate synthase [Dehalococcoidia bacterium]
MDKAPAARLPRRIYPLSTKDLTEEQLAVAFAMTSRRPEPFDEIAQEVSEEKAAQFHERWVLNYGHASVAEHAILHMAVENISRLACDSLEDNRLASYTEKSSRYQVIDTNAYYVPPELAGKPLQEVYVQACEALFSVYHRLVRDSIAFLPKTMPREEKERDAAYRLRLRRYAVDWCRFVLPTATLTNVGVTMNARSLEHAIRKLLSSDLQEEVQIGQELKEQGRKITPTLIKYADPNPYMTETRHAQEALASVVPARWEDAEVTAHLAHYDSDAERKVVAAVLYHYSHQPYAQVWQHVQKMTSAELERVMDEAMSRLGAHDVPLRELETVDYTYDLVMDYGAYREFKRHRMQTYLPQPLTVEHGYLTPALFYEAGLEEPFHEAMEVSARAYRRVASALPTVAQYLVTHAHKRRVLAKMNLRECYHLFKLRTQPTAHFTIIAVAQAALEEARRVHPLLFRHLRLRE